jgi:hypothetical protein
VSQSTGGKTAGVTGQSLPFFPTNSTT